MNIEEARKLRVGSRVQCPGDLGAKGFPGTVVHLGGVESVDIMGVSYLWITVERRPGARAVWPSNRLGLIRL